MDLIEKRITGEERYHGIVINVDVDQALSPSGAIVQREIVRHPGGVVVVPIDQDGKLVLVRQYRYVFSDFMLELPAGKREPNEDPMTGAARELKEEIGAEGTLASLGTLASSPGIFSEKLYLYLGTGLTFGETHPDPDEFIEIVRVTFEEAEQMILSGEIWDGKTVSGILKAKLFLESKIR